jgi:lipopolysaccharide export system permease protein
MKIYGTILFALSLLSQKNHKTQVKKLHKFILKMYLGPLIGSFFVAVFVLLMQFLWKYIDDLVGKGLEWYIITELLFYASATFVPMALPLAVLLSSIMTFGNLGERYELVALKASGISLQKIMYPLIVFIAVLSIAAFFFSNNVMPVANLKFRSILYDVKEQKLAFNIKEKIYYNGIDGYVIRVEKKGKDGNTLKGLKIYDHTDKKNQVKITVADSGVMHLSPDQSSLYFTLYNGYNYEEQEKRHDYDKRPLQRTHFKSQMMKFDLSGFNLQRTDEDLFRNNYHMLNLQQLSHTEDSLTETLNTRKKNYAGKIVRSTLFHFNRAKDLPDDRLLTDTIPVHFFDSLPVRERESLISMALSSARRNQNQLKYTIKDIESQERLINKYQVEWHRKFTLSFACLVFFFIGAPFGAIVRKGGLGLPLVVSVLFFVIYHIISITGEKYAKAGIVSVYEGMWIASALLLPVGIFLTIKATSDAPVFDAELWRRNIHKILKFMKIKS